MSDRITYCDVMETCEECPRYGDDCDGDKRNDDLISRADAIEAVRMSEHRITIADEQDGVGTVKWDMWGVYTAEAVEAIKALPSADAIDLDESCEKCEHHLKGANEVPCCYCTIGKSFYTPTIHDALSAEAVQTQAEKCDECIHKGTHKDKMTCKECADRALCIMSAPDGKWKACEDYRPSAEAVQGEWVLKEHLWECDQCGCRINRANPLKGNIWNYNFCPNCGADMRKEKP